MQIRFYSCFFSLPLKVHLSASLSLIIIVFNTKCETALALYILSSAASRTATPAQSNATAACFLRACVNEKEEQRWVVKMCIWLESVATVSKAIN